MGMPNWTTGPWQVVMQRPDGETLYAVSQHTHAMIAMKPDGYMVSPHDSDSLGRDDDGYFVPTEADAEAGIIDCDPRRIANARLISHAACMADVLAQWSAAEAMGDEQEMQNAREERDRILAELVGDK